MDVSVGRRYAFADARVLDCLKIDTGARRVANQVSGVRSKTVCLGGGSIKWYIFELFPKTVGTHIELRGARYPCRKDKARWGEHGAGNCHDRSWARVQVPAGVVALQSWELVVAWERWNTVKTQDGRLMDIG